MKHPRMDDYDTKALIVIGNQSDDEKTKNMIRRILVDRFNVVKYSISYLLGKFSLSDGIMKEVYADMIIMSMCMDKNSVPEEIEDELIEYASDDVIVSYGTVVESLDFRKKCRDKFWERALERDKSYKEMMQKKYR